MAVIALSSALVVGLTGPASAQAVTTGSLSFTSDPGDWVGLGESASYATSAGDVMSVTGSSDDNTVDVALTGAHGDWWYLTLAAPRGHVLSPGTYTGATRAAFRGPAEPGIDFSGDGRGCNTITGSFTVQSAVYGPHGYVQEFDATYEQHCEGGDPALRGEVHITNPPAPPELGLGLSVATDGTASTISGNAVVHGTVSCTKDATVNVSGTVVETKKRVLIRGSYTKQVVCTAGTPAAWSATAVPTGDTPFQKGKAQADTQATSQDSDYGNTVTAADTTIVTLSRVKS
jgi:hypothetical protein